MNRKKRATFYLKLLIPVLIIAGLYVVYNIKKHDFLHTGIQKLVERKTDSLYKITYDSISLNEIEGNLYIKNLHVKGDTARQLQLIKSGDTSAAKILLDIYIPLLKVVAFKTAKALLSKQLTCRQIIINNVKAVIYIFPGQAQHKDETQQQQALYKQILGNLKLIQAEDVSINNAQVLAKDFFNKETKFNTYNTSIGLHDVLIDSTYTQDTSRTFFCKAIKIISDKVVLGEKNNTAEISNLAFNTTSKVVDISRFDYDAFKNNGFFKTTLQNISVDGIEWKGPAEKSNLRIKNVVLQKGEIEALTGTEKNSTTNTNDKLLTGWLKNFSLNKLDVKSFIFTSRSRDNKKQPIVVKNNSLLLHGIRLNTKSKLDESLVNNIGEAEFNNDNLTIISADKFYAFKISGFRLNTKARKFWIKQAACIPQFSEEEFARRSKIQTDRYDVRLNNIECANVDISELLQGKLFASTLTTHNSLIKVYRDLSYPSTGKSNTGQYPQQLLFKFKVPVKIDKFNSYNNFIAYKERNALSDSSGTVTFNKSNVSITNISNQPPKPGDKSVVEFTSSFLNELPLSGSLIFYLDEWKKGTFKAEAKIDESFDAGVLNQLTEPMSLIKINSGVFDYISCSLMADNDVAKGNLIMTYHNFKLSLLKRKGEKIRKKNVTSILANAFIKNKNNDGANMRVATIDKKREAKRSFFNFVWVAILSGGLKIFGVPGKK